MTSLLSNLERQRYMHLSGVVDPSLVSTVRHLGFNLLRQPNVIQPECYRGDGLTGYTPPGIENVRNMPADWQRHFWDIGLPDRVHNPQCHHAAAFVASATTLAMQIEALANNLLRNLEAYIGSPANGLWRGMQDGQHHVRVSHYPPSNLSPESIIFPAHKDFSLVTVYIGGAEDGLEVWQDGEWMSLPNPLGDVVVATGTLLARYSDHRFLALPHRVRRGGGERLSVVMFTEPHHNTVLPGEPKQTAGEYLAERLAAVRKSQ